MEMMMVMVNRGGKKIIDDHHHHWRIAEIVALVVSDQSGSRLVYRPLHFVSTTLSTTQCNTEYTTVQHFILCSDQK